MKKNRSTLKDYFKKGAIPTEANFADLIDSMLNQEEDSIAKLPNDPLKITAIGVDEALVNFYRIDKNAEQLSWQVKQKLGGVAGLSISDTVGSRLFIENGTGNIGIGTTAPGAKLEVSGGAKITGDLQSKTLTVEGEVSIGSKSTTAVTDATAGYGAKLSFNGASLNTDPIWIARFNEASNITKLRINLSDDNVKDQLQIGYTYSVDGKWYTSFSVDTNGDTTIAGNLTLNGGKKIIFTDSDTSNNLKIQLWGGYGLGINNATLFYTADGKHSWRDKDSNERMLLTTGADGGLSVKGTGISSIAGSLGIGTTTPRSALDTFTGVLSGAANDYTKAQFTMSGGGTVTWGGPSGRLKWTTRFIAISMEKSVTFASGYVDMNQPTADLPAAQVYDGKARSADASGIVLNEWEALYAVHTVGGDNNAVTYRIVRYTNNINAPSNWILVAVANGDDKSIRLGTGVVITQNSSSSHSSPIPRGVITLWSGAVNGVPGGWSLCDGSNSTPDLRDRFIVGAGGSYNVGATGGAENVTLTTAQMPSHNHNNGDYKWLLQRDSSGRWTSKDTDTTVGEPDLLHSDSILASGGNQAHENRPPYYALAYIMKL